jgi:hypothetical protein
MASSKISELVDGGSFLPGDDTIIVRNGANFKVDPTINAVQAWVNFNGTGTVAIRASYNVSSITDNGTGDYTVNFTNAMTDANYCVSATTGGQTSGDSDSDRAIGTDGVTTSSVTIDTWNNDSDTRTDNTHNSICIFR